MLQLSTVDNDTWLLLQKLFTYSFVKEQFALAGGTALALYTGHRLSIDLDLFSPTVFSPENIEIELRNEFKQAYLPIGMNSRMLFSFIQNIKCDFVNEPFPLIEPFVETDGIKLFSIADICAMKMHTICGRGKKKDFFDIAVLIKNYGWKQMLLWFEQKYTNSQLYFLWKSIKYFDDAENDPEIVSFSPYNISWEETKDYILKNCE